MPAPSMPNSHTYPSSTCAPPAPAPHLTPPCPPPQVPVPRRGATSPLLPVGGSHCGSVSPTRGLLLRVAVPSRPTPPPQPQWMGVFEMSPQTPDSGDVPLSGSCRGALMTDSIFVSAIAPRRRRWIRSGAKVSQAQQKTHRVVSESELLSKEFAAIFGKWAKKPSVRGCVYYRTRILCRSHRSDSGLNLQLKPAKLPLFRIRAPRRRTGPLGFGPSGPEPEPRQVESSCVETG